MEVFDPGLAYCGLERVARGDEREDAHVVVAWQEA
jgi:hypothetical protein